MSWFLIAILSPALWSITNHIDKYLIGKYFKGGGTGALIIFSSIIGLFILPFILIFQPNVLGISPLQATAIIFSSIISLIAILIYLYALKRDEASIVVPLFQTIPIFAFILGYFVLDEVLTSRQVIGSLLVILGGVSLSLDLNNKIPKLKTAIFFLMFLSSFFIALSGLIFKVIAIETDFWTTAFWAYIGDVLMGIFFLVFITNYRIEFLKVIRENKLPILGLNTFNEIVNVIASLAFKFATLLAPLALVWTVNGFQPFFVFLYGVLITLFFPQIGTESLIKKHIVQKIVTIVVMFIGTYILNT